jgi:DNA repair protein RadC
LKYEAVFVILVHNHPSGDPTPSRQDLQITATIKKSGMLLGIPLIDHIIIGDQNYISLQEQKLM